MVSMGYNSCSTSSLVRLGWELLEFGSLASKLTQPCPVVDSECPECFVVLSDLDLSKGRITGRQAHMMPTPTSTAVHMLMLTKVPETKISGTY